jgi:phenylacetate-CoA ligase
MILEPDVEQMPRPRMRELQEVRLAAVVRYAAANVPFYAQRFEASGASPVEIKTLEDLEGLPLTTKDDLRDNYPFDLFAVPRTDVLRIHASSGTTGKPTVVGYTRADLNLFARVNARCLAMAGAEPGMILHNAYGYGLFTGGLGLHYGGERLGMAVVPVSGGMTDRQLTLIMDFEPEVICCTPSYALTLAQAFAAENVEASSISLRYALCGAEPWTHSMREAIDAGLGVKTTNIYGLSEIIGPGISNECVEERNGSHINEDFFYPEVVDPNSGEVLGPGEEGTLVLTTLTKEALPLIRYDTRDVCSLDYDECSCGRKLVKMSQIMGRTDDMLIIRGVNVYPSSIEAVLGRFEEITPHYLIRLTRTGHLDEATVEVEMSELFFRGSAATQDAGESADMDVLGARVAARIKDTLGIKINVELRPPNAVPRSQGGKIQRIEDLRST